MHFSFFSKDADFQGELFYIQSEQSLMYKPWNTNVNVGILFGYYTELGVICETNEIINIAGLNPKEKWLKKEMNVPSAKKGYLFAHFDKPPMRGTGVEYDRACETYYDEVTQYICIGDYETEDSDDCVEFANNIVAVLRGGRLIAIWAKIKEL
jgi:hypothetical protein